MLKGKATFSIVGRVFDAALYETTRPTLRIKILKNDDNYITVLAFGNIINQFISSFPLDTIKKNSSNNPWIYVDGVIGEKKYTKHGVLTAEIALMVTTLVAIDNSIKVSDEDVLNSIIGDNKEAV